MQKNLQSKTIEKRSQLKSGQITAVIYSIKIIIKFYLAANTVVTYPERHTVEDDSEKMQSNHNQNKLQIVVEPSLKIVGLVVQAIRMILISWPAVPGLIVQAIRMILIPWSAVPGLIVQGIKMILIP